jgi:signal transduction histidine kinase
VTSVETGSSSSPSAPVVDRALAERRIRELIVSRLRLGGILSLPFVVLYAIGDRWILDSPQADALLVLKAIPLAACLVAVLGPNVAWVRDRPVLPAVLCVIALGLTQSVSSVLEHEPVSLPIMLTSLGLTAAVYLPWGPAVQAMLSTLLFAMGVLGTAAIVGWSGLGSVAALTSLFGMVIVLGNSPVIASTIRSLMARGLELQTAKDRLGEILNKRLEEANEKLERRGVALEQALEEAEKANRSKGRFLATISHEFRTPLTSILGFGAMLRDGAAGPIDEKQMEYATEIALSAQQLLEIIEGVLSHARIESNDDPLQLSDVPVDLLVQVACRQIAPAAFEKDVRVQRPSPSGARLAGDKRKLLQVLLNLLGNAIKFSPPGNEVGVEVVDGGDTVEIAVWDRGIGIARDDLERIFDPFEQVDVANRTSRKGTGLGLSIARRVVEAHGGTIGVDSKAGDGSRFVVRLPKSAPSARPAAARGPRGEIDGYASRA